MQPIQVTSFRSGSVSTADAPTIHVYFGDESSSTRYENSYGGAIQVQNHVLIKGSRTVKGMIEDIDHDDDESSEAIPLTLGAEYQESFKSVLAFAEAIDQENIGSIAGDINHFLDFWKLNIYLDNEDLQKQLIQLMFSNPEQFDSERISEIISENSENKELVVAQAVQLLRVLLFAKALARSDFDFIAENIDCFTKYFRHVCADNESQEEFIKRLILVDMQDKHKPEHLLNALISFPVVLDSVEQKTFPLLMVAMVQSNFKESTAWSRYSKEQKSCLLEHCIEYFVEAEGYKVASNPLHKKFRRAKLEWLFCIFVQLNPDFLEVDFLSNTSENLNENLDTACANLGVIGDKIISKISELNSEDNIAWADIDIQSVMRELIWQKLVSCIIDNPFNSDQILQKRVWVLENVCLKENRTFFNDEDAVDLRWELIQKKAAQLESYQNINAAILKFRIKIQTPLKITKWKIILLPAPLLDLLYIYRVFKNYPQLEITEQDKKSIKTVFNEEIAPAYFKIATDRFTELNNLKVTMPVSSMPFSNYDEFHKISPPSINPVSTWAGKRVKKVPLKKLSDYAVKRVALIIYSVVSAPFATLSGVYHTFTNSNEVWVNKWQCSGHIGGAIGSAMTLSALILWSTTKNAKDVKAFLSAVDISVLRICYAFATLFLFVLLISVHDNLKKSQDNGEPPVNSKLLPWIEKKVHRPVSWFLYRYLKV